MIPSPPPMDTGASPLIPKNVHDIPHTGNVPCNLVPYLLEFEDHLWHVSDPTSNRICTGVEESTTSASTQHHEPHIYRIQSPAIKR